MPRKLLDIEVDEVSLVDAAANRRRFAIIKRRQQDMDELITHLKKMMGGEAKDEELEKAKQLSEEASKALKGALNILNKYKDEMPDDVLTAIKTLTKYASYGYPEAKAKAEELTKEDIEKIGAKLSKATIEQLKIAKEIISGIDVKSLKKVGEIIDQLIGDAGLEKQYEKLPEDVRKRLLRLDAIDAEAKRKAEQDSIQTVIKAAIDDAVKPLQETVDKLAKAKGIKKSVDGQVGDPDKKDKDLEDKWPSLSRSEE